MRGIATNIALFICTLIFLEGASFVVYRLSFGEHFSFARLHAQQQSIQSDPSSDIQQVIAGSLAVPHPYLGFVYDHRTAVRHAGLGVTDFGFIDDKSPLQKRDPKKVIVGFFGGSVAWWLQSLGGELIRTELAKHERFKDKEIVFVRVALGAYKQPQQLQALTYLLALGAEFDIVINIDGYNDLTISRIEYQHSPFFPHFWSEQIQALPSRAKLLQLARLEALREQRIKRAQIFTAALLRYSVTAQTSWAFLDRSILGQLSTERSAAPALANGAGAAELSPAAKGPQHQYATKAEYIEGLAEIWERSSRLMQQLCKERGITYVHFLQPNQYYPDSKSMSEEERKIAISPTAWDGEPVAIGYPKLRERGLALAKEGINFYDASMIFKETTEATYIDNCCHLTELGNNLFARFLASSLLDAAGQKDNL